MKKLIMFVGIFCALVLVCDARNERGAINFSGDINFDGNWAVAGTKITASGAQLNTLVDGGVLGALDGSGVTNITLANVATLGDGSVSNAVASVVERVAELKSTVISLTNVVLTTTAGDDEGESQEVYVFADGAVTLSLAVMDGVVVSSGGITGTVLYVSVGTAAAGDDADLTGTEADIIPRTTIDQSASGVTTNDFDAIVAAVIIFDGTSTATRIHVNLAIDQDGQQYNATNTFTGTLTLYYPKPVDNQ